MESIGYVALRIFSSGGNNTALAYTSMARGSSRAMDYNGTEVLGFLVLAVVLCAALGGVIAMIVHYSKPPPVSPRQHLLGNW